MANLVGVILDKNLSIHERGAGFFQKSRRPSIVALMAMVLATGAGVVSAQSLRDRDGDGVPDLLDNCINVANPDQLDTDMDGFGDACDADVNNDGVVNYDDLVMILSNWGKVGPGDTNGDGKVDAEDWVFVEKMQGTKPGPTGVRPLVPTSDGRKFPVADRVQRMRLKTPLPDGRNVWVVADFRSFMKSAMIKEVPSVIRIRSGADIEALERMKITPEDLGLPNKAGAAAGELVVLNDLGVMGDQVAGDRIFSGFAKINEASERASVETLMKRQRTVGKSSVLVFSGRVVSRVAPFDFNKPFISGGVRQTISFTLPGVGQIVEEVEPLDTLLNEMPASTATDRTLMITSPGVVGDPVRTFSLCDKDGKVAPTGNPNGVWSFKSLMTTMAESSGGLPAKLFTHNWLNQWMTSSSGAKHSDNTFVGSVIPVRSNVLWDLVKGFQPGWDLNNYNSLDMDKLPFRLLAIVNRIDLASSGPVLNSYASSSGELRFVFGLVERRAEGCVPSPGMTVIMEYKLHNRGTCDGTRMMASKWVRLNNYVPGTEGYNQRLALITSPITGRSNSIGQVRTNEVRLANVAVDGYPSWEMREFTLQGGWGNAELKPATLKGTPHVAMNNTFALLSIINGAPLVAGNHATHVRYGGNFDSSPPWDSSPSSSINKRFLFSSGTCNGCHLGENGTRFMMVDSGGAIGVSATLAPFLTGVSDVPDLKYSTPRRSFNDLERRGQILDALASRSCLSLLTKTNNGMELELPVRSILEPLEIH